MELIIFKYGVKHAISERILRIKWAAVTLQVRASPPELCISPPPLPPPYRDLFLPKDQSF